MKIETQIFLADEVLAVHRERVRNLFPAYSFIHVCRTIDYFAQSIALASGYWVETGRPEWTNEIGRIIQMHHKIRAVRGDSRRLVDLFRRADSVSSNTMRLIAASEQAKSTSRPANLFPLVGVTC